jgi:hypothetical protein
MSLELVSSLPGVKSKLDPAFLKDVSLYIDPSEADFLIKIYFLIKFI